MIELLFYIACFNAFLLKLITREGLFYKQGNGIRVFILNQLPDTKFKDIIRKWFKCYPCRFFILSVFESLVLAAIYFLSWKMVVAPFVIACISTILLTFIKPGWQNEND
jgi:hypothetical protein